MIEIADSSSCFAEVSDDSSDQRYAIHRSSQHDVINVSGYVVLA